MYHGARIGVDFTYNLGARIGVDFTYNLGVNNKFFSYIPTSNISQNIFQNFSKHISQNIFLKIFFKISVMIDHFLSTTSLITGNG